MPALAAHWTGNELYWDHSEIGRIWILTQSARGLGARIVNLAGDVRATLLRNRNDGHQRFSLRHGPPRLRALSRLAAAGRPDDRRRTGIPENGTRLS